MGSPRSILRLGCLALLLGAGTAAPTTTAETPARHLALGSPAADTLPPDDRHTWTLTATAGRPLRLRVGLAGHAASLRWRDPDGHELSTIVLPWGRTVPVVVTPTVDGPHTIELEARERGAPVGRYTLEADEPGPAVAAADRAFTEGLRRAASDAPDELRAAVTAFETARQLYAERGDAAGELRAIESLADGHGRLGERDTEIDLGRQAIDRLRALDRSPSVLRAESRLLDDLCLALVRAGQLDAAREAAEAAIERGRLADDRLGTWRARANLGLVHLRSGDWPAARATYEALLRELEGRGERRMETRVSTNLAGVHANLGETDRAIAVLRRALEGARAIGDIDAEARLANNLGALCRRIGEPEQAVEHYRLALDRFERQHDRYWQARTLNNLGFTLLGLGDLDRATERFDASLRLRREVSDRRGEAVTLRNLGRADELRGDLVAARAHHAEALAIARELDDRRGEADALTLLGRVRRRLGEPGALEQLDAALAIRRDLDDRVGVAHVLRELAEAHLAHGRPDAARPLLDDALATHRATREPAAEMETLYGLARVERAAGRDDLAVARLRAALDLVETLRQRIADPLDRATFLAARGDAYALLVDLLVERHRREPDGGHHLAALTVSERARARTLLDLLDTPEGVPTAIDGAAVPTLLGPGEVLIEVALGEARSHLWRVRADGVEHSILPGRRHLADLARRVHGDWSRLDLLGDPATPHAAAVELSNLLLGSLAGDGSVERLVIVADGALHLVPFAALPWSGDPSTPVIEKVEVVHLPSASALAAQRDRATATRSRGVAVFADPIFDATDPRLPSDRSVADPPSSLVGDAPGREPLGRLPRTLDEASAISELVPPEHRLVALGADARLDRLSDDSVASARALHFATHGVLDPRRPERSGLVLSRFSADGRPIDGLLGVRDLLALDLDAELVVLSGCRTALGPEVRGEGLIGLATGFAYAGVPRVVASLWQVQDAATAELMTRFYRAHLVDGLPAPTALRRAQRAIRRDPRWRDPFYWAAFVHQGGP